MNNTDPMKVEVSAVQPAADPAAAPILPSEQAKVEAFKPLDKFKDMEAQARAYVELEKHLGKSAEPTKVEAAAPAESLQITKVTEDAATEAGINLPRYADEYTRTGELSKESRAELAAKGIPDAMVDKYINGEKATQVLYANDIAARVGVDAKALGEVREWAGRSLNEGELAVYNDAVLSGNPDKAAFALKALHSRFVSANGNDSQRMLHGGTSATSQAEYTKADMMKDMGSPQYRIDPAFQARVQARVASMKE